MMTFALILDASEPSFQLIWTALVEYHLSDMRAAKREFELSVKTADPAYLGEDIWGWLETTSRALGLQAEAENYRKMKANSLPKTKTH